ncbi:MAG: replicative DNA helicase [Acidimicrobiales bacterium]
MQGSRPASLARVPPNNLRAEESVLGAMLLSREAIAEVVEILEPDHFYKPAHGHLYDAMLSLYSGGEPVDAVTVADELKRAGLLDEVGGPAVLLDFQATTPAISNAAHYARIVEEHALLRRMIAVSNEIAETAYGIPEDVIKAVDEAEARMFDVAQRRVTNTTSAIRDLLPANLDRIEMLYDRGESITGSSTGYLDLDEKLAGLQPSALYVVGARPAMGKALALDTPIATPEGWSTMGDIDVGDRVFDESGRPCSVTYKSPVFTGNECYEVIFDDGAVVVADADHQWSTWDDRAWRSERGHHALDAGGPVARPQLARNQDRKRTWPAVRTTREIAGSLRTGKDQRPNHRVPTALPLDLPELDLALDPYLLGCWLGDGPTGRPQLTTVDREIVAAFEDAGWSPAPAASQHRVEAVTSVLHHPGDGPADHDQPGDEPTLEFTGRLVDLGLWPGAKRIPPVYLRASAKQRLALLHGLMDTDGWVEGHGTCRLARPERDLIDDVRELALSLGYKAGAPRHEVSNAGSDVWTLDFAPADPVFRLARKAATQPIDRGPNARPRWRTIVDVRPLPTVPTQCISVDSPSHLYLAGREMVPTHNTAFALGMACNSAMKDNKPVLIFTLEMSNLELSQRLLCSEARVDAGRVKTGRLEEGEWNRISHAVGRLAEAPIFIDDSPHTSVMDIRAKARRLKSREGELGMVVVDYIQLMSGRASAESRQVEVSEISRNLKILARELETPVVALAQLNRSLEQRTDKRPMLSDLRESGCVPASTRILRADGTETTMGHLLLSQETPLVWAIDDRGCIVARRLIKTFGSGIKPVYRLRLASGRQVEATGNHRFMTVDGWRPLAGLRVGESLATPCRLPEPDELVEWPDAEVVLLAHLLGAGPLVSPESYSSTDEANIEAVCQAVRHFGCEATVETAEPAPEGTGHLLVARPSGVARGVHHPIRAWLEQLGLGGRWPFETIVPEQVHRLGDKQIALFLHHLWSTDGSITIGGDGRRPVVRCRYATSSRGLALGIQRLLLRLEIRSIVSLAPNAGSGEGHHICVEGRPNLLRFLSLVGCHGQGGARVPEAIEILAGEGLDSSEPVPIARSDVHWDEIVGIEPRGEQPVFDATVEGVHNFVADGVVAHNSLEQDADVVLFLYRDEVYDDTSPDKGVAEVIIAKHRNGPTGKARLAFLGQYTRFENMAKSAPPGGPPASADRTDPGAEEF